jgi:TetR/AcrR family transcriptional repressor of bet genes
MSINAISEIFEATDGPLTRSLVSTIFRLVNQFIMPRPTNTDARRVQIVRGLMKAMATNGYDGATIQAIAREAKLTPGVVHYHFPSKQAVLLALVEQLAVTTENRLQKRLQNAQSARDRLLAFVDAHVALDEDADSDAVGCWVQIAAESLRQPEVGEVYQSIVKHELAVLCELVVDALHEANKAPEADDTAAEIAAALYSTIQGAFQLGVATRTLPSGFATPMFRRMVDGLLSGELSHA